MIRATLVGAGAVAAVRDRERGVRRHALDLRGRAAAPPPPEQEAQAALGLREAIGELGLLIAAHPALRAYMLANALWELSLGAIKTFLVLFLSAGLGNSHHSGVDHRRRRGDHPGLGIDSAAGSRTGRVPTRPEHRAVGLRARSARAAGDPISLPGLTDASGDRVRRRRGYEPALRNPDADDACPVARRRNGVLLVEPRRADDARTGAGGGSGRAFARAGFIHPMATPRSGGWQERRFCSACCHSSG